MVPLKQAMMSLTKIDKRWKRGYNDDDGEIAQMIVGGKQRLYIATNSSIDTFHAAAKSVGVEIRWDTVTRNGKRFYYGLWAETGSSNLSDGWTCTSDFKTPALAIRAAFIAAVEYKLKETGKCSVCGGPHDGPGGYAHPTKCFHCAPAAVSLKKKRRSGERKRCAGRVPFPKGEWRRLRKGEIISSEDRFVHADSWESTGDVGRRVGYNYSGEELDRPELVYITKRKSNRGTK